MQRRTKLAKVIVFADKRRNVTGDIVHCNLQLIQYTLAHVCNRLGKKKRKMKKKERKKAKSYAKVAQYSQQQKHEQSLQFEYKQSFSNNDPVDHGICFMYMCAVQYIAQHLLHHNTSSAFQFQIFWLDNNVMWHPHEDVQFLFLFFSPFFFKSTSSENDVQFFQSLHDTLFFYSQL